MVFEYILLGFVLTALGVAAIMAQKGEDELLYKLERQPPTELEDATENVLMKISGKVEPINTVVSELANRECVYYHSFKEEYRKQGKSSRWITVLDKIVTIPFEVRDATGWINVDLNGADKNWIDPEDVLR
ncbi:MAG: hypothetical protein ABIG96_03450 [Candidatus Micrarchaeota archaeon]